MSIFSPGSSPSPTETELRSFKEVSYDGCEASLGKGQAVEPEEKTAAHILRFLEEFCG